MKIAVQLGLLPGQSTQDKAKWAADHGVQGLELSAFSGGVDSMKQIAADINGLVPICSVCGNATLDGGRGFRALTRSHRFGALAVIVACWAITGQGMLFLLALGAGYRVFWQKDFAGSADWVALAQFTGLVAVLSFLSER